MDGWMDYTAITPVKKDKCCLGILCTLLKFLNKNNYVLLGMYLTGAAVGKSSFVRGNSHI